ncbi:hypothetical protein MycrhDRAFT_1456 [Mycolicibacterium rhodesiae JS60]|nr:hypothetical protein MycrhDRAFT_1456 [Mycolicibacterium rhodesiae JS60]
MSDIWKSVEIFLPSDMSKDAVRDTLLDEIICTATDAGDFVHRLRIGGSVPHADGWRKWTASYLPGPPGVFRCNRLLGPGADTSSGPGETPLSGTDAVSIPVL